MSVKARAKLRLFSFWDFQAEGETLGPPGRVLARERRGRLGVFPSTQDLSSVPEDEPPPGSGQPPLPDGWARGIREQRIPEVRRLKKQTFLII